MCYPKGWIANSELLECGVDKPDNNKLRYDDELQVDWWPWKNKQWQEECWNLPHPIEALTKSKCKVLYFYYISLVSKDTKNVLSE